MTAMPPEQTQIFDPATSDPKSFRKVLGQFGTGVTVVTCATPEGPMGITANSFSSVSLEPPLVLWCPAKTSSRYQFFAQAKNFAIHVMGADQFDLAKGFAMSGQAFDGLDWEESATGVPLLNTCLARFECSQHAIHDAGDHAVVLGLVTRATMREGDPLIFFGGDYGSFAGTT